MRAFSSRGIGLIAASLLLGGGLFWGARSCGTADPGLVGEWRGYRNLPEGDDRTLTNNIASIRLTLEAGGKFQLTDGGLPFAGRWRRREDALALDVEAIMGRPIGAEPGAKRATDAFAGTIRKEAIDLRTLSGEIVTLTRFRP